MGKGNRNSKYQEAYNMSGASSVKTVKNGGKKKDMTNVCITLVIAILVLGSVLLFVFSSTGVVNRGTKLAYTDNYTVDASMITYYEYQLLNQTFSSYYNYYYQMTYDAEQAYNFTQQYVANQSYREGAIDIVKELLILCESAKAEGMTLDADDTALIEDNIAQLGNTSTTFGRGVMKSDIRKALELQVLANKYYEKFTDDVEASMTEEELKAYMDENKASFYVTDYLAAEISILTENYESDKEGFAAAKALVDEYATKFVDAKSADEFKTLLIEYTVKSQFDELVATEIDSAIKPDNATLNTYEQAIIEDIVKLNIETGSSITLDMGVEGELGDALSTIKQTLVEKCNTALVNAAKTQAYVDSTSTDEEITDDIKWLISADRKAGDVNKITLSDKAGYGYSFNMIDKALYVNDEISRNVGHILISAEEGVATEEEIAAAETKANEVLAKYLEGEKTEEAFEELGWGYTADSNVFYDNVLKGKMVETFDAWLFDSSREEGDTGIVKTEFGFHVMLYRGEDEVATANAKAGVASEKYSDYLKANEGKVTIHAKYVTE